jgi:hypothetical protein
MSSKVSQETQEFLQLREELRAGTIGSRMKLLILATTPEKRRFPILEGLTGVAENTWRTWWTKGATPSGALVEGVSRAWPEYAFWLASGLTDVEFGHRMPSLHESVVGYVNNFPEGRLKRDRVLAAEYFKVCRELQDLEKAELADKKLDLSQRQEILENTRQFIIQKRREEISPPPEDA